MHTIKLLDCTLRDGGYVNNWNFGKENIPQIIHSLENSKVNILEIGFLKNETYYKDRTVFNSMKQVKEIIPKKQNGLLYAVMAEVVNPLPLEMLDPADEESADIIRVIVWKTKHDPNGKSTDALQAGYDYCKGIIEKGYKLCVQPARVDQYSDEEFKSMLHKFSALNPMAIYIVDSWGTMQAEQILHYIHIADKILPTSISIGYHGHDNMMQAFSTAKEILKLNLKRNIIIDASIYGIGRGAGNLHTEIIAEYMNRYIKSNYNINYMIDIFDQCLKQIYSKIPWGYSMGLFLAGKYNCNPNYALYFENSAKLSSSRIRKIFESMSEYDRTMYSEKTAKKYLQSII